MQNHFNQDPGIHAFTAIDRPYVQNFQEGLVQDWHRQLVTFWFRSAGVPGSKHKRVFEYENKEVEGTSISKVLDSP